MHYAVMFGRLQAKRDSEAVSVQPGLVPVIGIETGNIFSKKVSHPTFLQR
jgi:hypothetical protein